MLRVTGRWPANKLGHRQLYHIQRAQSLLRTQPILQRSIVTVKPTGETLSLMSSHCYRLASGATSPIFLHSNSVSHFFLLLGDLSTWTFSKKVEGTTFSHCPYRIESQRRILFFQYSQDISRSSIFLRTHQFSFLVLCKEQ